MDGFSAPSFSLGLDLDLDIADLPTEGEEEEEEEEQPQAPLPNPSPAFASPTFELFPDQDFDEREATDAEEALDPVPIEETPPPALKRLRRGPPPPPPRRHGPSPAAHSPLDDGGGGPKDVSTPLDDDIEEFSSQEDNPSRDKFSSIQSQITHGASKFSLQNRGVLTSQSTTKLKVPKISPPSDALTSAVSQECSDKKLIQKSTITPIRKIHLLSSDSDNSSGEDEYKRNDKVDASKMRHQNPMTENEQQRCSKYRKPQEDSLWKDVSPKTNINLATPALDGFCDEYFKSTKNPKSGQHREEDTSFCSSRVTSTKELVHGVEDYHQQKSITRNTKQKCNLSNPEPPAFQYFYHDDIRIQMLVKERLCHFVPLGAEVHGAHKDPGTENLNYMSQFSTDVHSQAHKTCKRGLDRSCPKGKRPKNASLKESLDATGSWVSPRSSAAIPKDAGKRRVHADGHQSGHWFTGQDGRKVYVTKDGRELTGRVAYRQYRKESGAGFKKSRKKAPAKKKKK